MTRYYFHIRDGRDYTDVDGLDLETLDEVATEAWGFAHDVIRMHPQREDWSGWSVRVTSDDSTEIMVIPFTDVIEARRAGRN